MGRRNRRGKHPQAVPPVSGGAQPAGSAPASPVTRIPQTPARQWRVEATAFAGPLPPPEILARYNDAFPGCAERIVQMAETQSHHRQSLEDRALTGRLANERVGQWMAFGLAAVAISGAIYLMAIGRFEAGATVFGTTVATIVGSFLYGRRRQRQELEEKAGAFGPRDLAPPG